MSETISMDLIVVEQLPIIRESLKTLSDDFDEKLKIAESLVCSEDNYKEIKKIRADFNKDFDAIEAERKKVKEAVTKPYAELEKIYKELISDKHKAGKAVLDKKIGAVESELKAQKTETIKAYFDEYAQSQGVAEYADFARQMDDIRISSTDTALKRISKERIDSLVIGLKAVEAQPEELQSEILAEFKKTLRATAAITIVSERHKAIAEQKKAQEARAEQKAAEAEAVERVESATAPPVAPPSVAPVVAVDEDPEMTVTFPYIAAKGRISKLKGLKQTMIEYCADNGIELIREDVQK